MRINEDMATEDVALEEDLKIDKKVEDILRESEENLIRMHLNKTVGYRSSVIDDNEELADYRILGNFMNAISALSACISNEIASIKKAHYEKSKESEVIRLLMSEKKNIDDYNNNLAILRKNLVPPSNLAHHPELASSMRTILTKEYDELHDFYQDIISLNSEVMVELENLLHRR